MKSLVDECLEKIGQDEPEVTESGVIGPYSSVEREMKYEPRPIDTGVSIRNSELYDGGW